MSQLTPQGWPESGVSGEYLLVDAEPVSCCIFRGREELRYLAETSCLDKQNFLLVLVSLELLRKISHVNMHTCLLYTMVVSRCLEPEFLLSLPTQVVGVMGIVLQSI